jgi:choline dehydrogenase-like flavoprotein
MKEALNGRRVGLSLGRALGGSSAINGQTFIPTSRANIDAWGEMGNPGWNWDALAPYFKRSYTLNPPDNKTAHHLCLEEFDKFTPVNSGPIQASFANDSSDPLLQAWVETMDSVGYGLRIAPTAGDRTGAFLNPATIDSDTHQRSYSASAYYKPVEDRPNLKLITGACVQRILLTGSYPDVIATGVEYTKDSDSFIVHAKEEVVLAAGAIHSPKLLELSGIGGSKCLKACGIRPIIDNPHVGENLQDHPVSGISVEVREGVDTMDGMLRIDTKLIQTAMQEYTSHGTGPLAQSGVNCYAILEGQSASRSKKKKSDPKPSPAGFFAYAAQRSFGAEEPHNGLVTSNILPGNFYSISASLLQPLSRGSTHIQSSSPADPPKIDPQYLSHPADLDTFAHHMTFISRLITTPPFSNLLKPNGLRNPSAPRDLTSEEEMKDYLKKTATSAWSPTSTCAMLPEEKGGVVNERLVVHGMRNLRVVDASIFSVTTMGNPMATVYAVAERAADFVSQDLARRQNRQ